MAIKIQAAALILPPSRFREDFERRLRLAVPNLNLVVLDPILAGSNDSRALSEFDALFTFGPFLSDEAIAGAKRLRWVQCLGTGVDGIVDRPTLGTQVWVTSARGVHAASVSETALALMMALSRDIPKLVKSQMAHKWSPGPAQLLSGCTVGILGVGLISEALAKRCRSFDMRVEGITRRTSAPYFDRLYPYGEIETAVANFDYFVLLADLTPETRNVVDTSVIRAMKTDAFLVNVGRGGVVDESAMVAALESRQLRAAALDVFAVEPLLPESPLWDLPNVLISPHSAGQHKDYARDVVPIIAANHNALSAGQFDAISNVVRRPSM